MRLGRAESEYTVKEQKANQSEGGEQKWGQNTILPNILTKGYFGSDNNK